MKRSLLSSSIAGFAALSFLAGGARGSDTEDIQQLYADENMVSIATGRSMPLNLAPAVATVITAEELEAIGATTLSEALELAPGVNGIYRPHSDDYAIRSIQSNSNFNPEVTILLDGVPQNDLHFGNQRKYIAQIPWQNVARIEVIRGPGSALYGADAFSGVINIVTKKADSFPAVMASVRGGSFDTGEARLTSKGTVGDVSSVLSLQLRTTDGHEPIIESDAQTYWDQVFGTSASLAPGPMQTWRDDYNVMWDLTKNNWMLRLRAWEHELGISGLVGALDNQGVTKSAVQSVDLRYEEPSTASRWSLRWDLNYFKYRINTEDALGYPPGAFGGAFPDGLRDDPGYSEDRVRTELVGLYSGFSDHITRIGAGAEHGRVYGLHETRNFVYSPFGIPVPTGQLYEVSEAELFSRAGDRTLYFVYGQDEWTLAQDWVLTTGLRYDHYSDFGSTVNPRIALVWTTRQDLTTKFLVGRAFRAPTLLDLNAQNTPAIIGNPDLKPVRITTYEVAFDYRPTQTLHSGLNFFYHDIEDQIDAVPSPFGTTSNNIAGQVGHGIEWDVRWNINRDLTLRGYYAYQDNELKESHLSPGFAPQNSANLRLDWRFLSAWRFNVNVRWVADRDRAPGDPREPVDDYTVVDTTVRYKPSRTNWEAALSVFNLFDRDARDPSQTDGFANDFPLPGRSIFAEVRTTWN